MVDFLDKNNIGTTHTQMLLESITYSVHSRERPRTILCRLRVYGNLFEYTFSRSAPIAIVQIHLKRSVSTCAHNARDSHDTLVARERFFFPPSTIGHRSRVRQTPSGYGKTTVSLAVQRSKFPANTAINPTQTRSAGCFVVSCVFLFSVLVVRYEWKKNARRKHSRMTVRTADTVLARFRARERL